MESQAWIQAQLIAIFRLPMTKPQEDLKSTLPKPIEISIGLS
jgi:hypothetical protein